MTVAECGRWPSLWYRSERGGYGYVTKVPCRILTRTEKRAKIEALKADGSVVIRSVQPEKIATRKGEARCDCPWCSNPQENSNVD